MNEIAYSMARAPFTAAEGDHDLGLLYGPMGQAIFDTDFYLSQLGDGDTAARADPVAHYAREGYLRGLDPSPYFSTAYYLEMAPDVRAAGRNPLAHYVEDGASEGRSFHPRFSIPYYLERRPEPAELGRDALSDFLHFGRQHGIVPDPYFDPVLAAELYPRCASTVECWTHYLVTAAGRADDPFPISPVVQAVIDQMPQYSVYAARFAVLFDVDYYLAQLRARGIELEPAETLLHYLTTGHRTINPHPLFDTGHYCKNNPDVKGQVPLIHYITSGANEGRHPHPLFTAFKPGATKRAGGRVPLYEYLLLPPDERASPSPYFDAQFYRGEHRDIDWKATDPICHYIAVGAANGWQPHPLFDPAHYAKSQRWRYVPGAGTPLADFVTRPAAEQPGTFALFDSEFYRATYPDIRDFETGPVSHFLFHGNRELRRPNRIRSEEYIYATQCRTAFHDRTALEEYLALGLNYRARVLFIGHEATRTGAPAILLGLVKHFSQMAQVECITILDQDGPLLAEFEKCSHTYVPLISRADVWSKTASFAAMKDELNNLLDRFADNPPLIAVCNSIETRLYAQFFKEIGIPVVFLVHEVADFYPADELQLVVDSSERVIYPAIYVREAMRQWCPLLPGQDLVLPQGLLRENFGSAVRIGRARAFEDHPIDDEDFVVVGCGTLDGRKGFDLFVTIARRLRDRYHGDRPVKFLWVGGSKHWRRLEGAPYDCIRYWACWELERNHLEDMVLVTGEVPNIEPFLLHSDVFLLPSRADPLPCVVHEAMACALPVLCFENCGGTPEAIGDGGMVLPYQDVDAAADAIIALAADEDRRLAIGRAAHDRVRAEYRFADYAGRIGGVLDDVLHRSEPFFRAPLPPVPTRGRVYFTMPGWNVSGVNTFTEALVEHLNDNGFEAEIVFTPGRHIANRFAADEAVDWPRVPYRFLQPQDAVNRSTWGDVLRQFLEERAPCVFIPNYDYVVSPVVANLPSSIGVVGIAHADDREHYAHCYRLGHYWNRIVAVCDAIKRQLVGQNPGFVEKTTVIRYGLSPPDQAELSAAFSRKLRNASPLEIVYAGRFEVFQKRIDDYVALARKLAASDIAFRLHMIGNGGEFARISRLLSPLVQAGLVVLPGRLDHAEVRRVMLDAHCVVLLSDFEGLPLSLIEAMHAGCVPITYDARGGIPEIVKHGVNGFVVAKRSLDDIVDHLRRLQADAELRRKMAKRAIRTMQTHNLTQRAMGAQYEALLDGIFAEIREGAYVRPAPLTI